MRILYICITTTAILFRSAIAATGQKEALTIPDLLQLPLAESLSENIDISGSFRVAASGTTRAILRPTVSPEQLRLVITYQDTTPPAENTIISLSGEDSLLFIVTKVSKKDDVSPTTISVTAISNN